MHDTLFIFELIPFFILVECDDGFYNRSCTGVCGNCKNGAYCEKENGYCPIGCINNFKYPFCKGTAVYTFYSIIFVPLTLGYQIISNIIHSFYVFQNLHSLSMK